MRRWAGPLVTALILGGVVLILALNLNLKGGPSTASPGPPTAPAPPEPGAGKPKDFREYPIGEPHFQAGMKIAAVWLPPIRMDGMAEPSGADLIHLEADIHATEGNRNGFALGEFVPYLRIAYKIAPAGGGGPIQQGDLMPMVAIDGLHYGASVLMPKAGAYTLTFEIKPPSAGGLGRHSDPATGVAPWWEPFQVAFDWEYQGPPSAGGH